MTRETQRRRRSTRQRDLWSLGSPRPAHSMHVRVSSQTASSRWSGVTSDTSSWRLRAPARNTCTVIPSRFRPVMRSLFYLAWGFPASAAGWRSVTSATASAVECLPVKGRTGVKGSVQIAHQTG